MRAFDTYTERFFAMSKLEDFSLQSQLLRPIRQMLNEALVPLESFMHSFLLPSATLPLWRK